MPTLMQRGATWLGERLKTAAGLVGTYRQGNRVSDSINGVMALQEYELHQADGTSTLVAAHDWTFTAADLEFTDGNAITPRDGDRWTATVNGNVETYEVLPIGNRPCFERADTSGLLLLVHTKKV